MKTYLHHIDLYMTKKIWLSERCVYLIIDFLEEWFVIWDSSAKESIKPKITWGLLKEHVPNLIAHVIFPLMCLTQEDLDLWEEDAVEYLHKKIGNPFHISHWLSDVYEENLSPDVAASRFLITLAGKRQKSSFSGILQFINTTLSLWSRLLLKLTISPDIGKHPERKEAALRMIGLVSHIIMKKGSPILSMMESFMVSHVYSEFHSPHGYLRARACEVLNRFSEIDFENHNVSYRSKVSAKLRTSSLHSN